MSTQVLGIGFQCKVYKKNPRIRLFIGDVFIDEFDQKNYVSNLEKNNTWSVPYQKIDFNTYKIKLIEIPDELLTEQQGKVKIEVKNDDSNWTNGFMTKSTNLCLDTCFIIQKKILENCDWNKIKNKHYYQLGYNRSGRMKSIDTMKKWYKDRSKWPYIEPYTTTWVSKNNHKIDHVLDCWIGGSGQYMMTFHKKHMNWHPFVTKGYFILAENVIDNFFIPLQNKYFLNENH